VDVSLEKTTLGESVRISWSFPGQLDTGCWQIARQACCLPVHFLSPALHQLSLSSTKQRAAHQLLPLIERKGSWAFFFKLGKGKGESGHLWNVMQGWLVGLEFC
jgi:hypothetical protein